MTKSKMLFTLNNGKQKWMTKREYNAYKKRLITLKPLYDEYINYEYLNQNDDNINKIHTLVDLACTLMGTICNVADSITITGYNKVKNEICDKINKSDFIEIVKYVSTHMDKFIQKDDTKFTQKLLNEIDKSIYKINFKRIFYQNYIDSNDIVFPKYSKNVIFPQLTKSENNKKFNEIVKSCATARKYIDSKLWPAFREYANVAEYISQGELDYNDFKQLVDYQYYSGNSDKRFQNQKKQYKIMINNFLKAYKLCKKFDYNYFDDVENEIYELTQYCNNQY